MEIIPLIYLKKGKMYSNPNKQVISDGEIINKLSDEKGLYIYDLDGLEKNNPNLYTYQRFAPLAGLWVDSGPRELGDVVDNLMAGAENIVIREKYWPDLDVQKIRNITKNQVFYKIDLKNWDMSSYNIPSKNEVDGVVFLNNMQQIENYQVSRYIQLLGEKNNVYGFENQSDDISKWEELNIKGLFVEIKEF